MTPTGRRKLLANEKDLTKHFDRLNAERPPLPIVNIEKESVFEAQMATRASETSSKTAATHFLSLHLRLSLGQDLLRLNGVW